MIGRDERRISRRDLLRTSIALGTGAATAAWIPAPTLARPATAQATPEISLSYGRPELLAGPTAIPAGYEPFALMSAETYAKGHIAGSGQIDWSALNLASTTETAIASWEVRTRDALAPAGALDRPVFAYDEGTLFAARLWWVLFFLDAPPATVLNGGLPAWVAANRNIEIGNPRPRPVPAGATPAAGSAPGVRRDALATLDEVKALIGDPSVVLVDARSATEYAAGHIPGAVNLEYTRNAQAASPPLWKPASELREMYASLGATSGKRIIPYCSTGVRSAVTFFTLWLLGFPAVSLYTGSWQEWGTDSTTPKTSGDKP